MCDFHDTADGHPLKTWRTWAEVEEGIKKARQDTRLVLERSQTQHQELERTRQARWDRHHQAIDDIWQRHHQAIDDIWQRHRAGLERQDDMIAEIRQRNRVRFERLEKMAGDIHALYLETVRRRLDARPEAQPKGAPQRKITSRDEARHAYRKEFQAFRYNHVPRWGQKEHAHWLGISVSLLTNMESGKSEQRFSDDTLNRCLKQMGLEEIKPAK